MSKRVQLKIKDKHLEIFQYTSSNRFENILSSTVGSCKYDKCDKTINFISYIEDIDRFVLYALKSEKHHTSCSTIFLLRPRTLKHYYNKSDFKIFDKSIKNKIEAYITD